MKISNDCEHTLNTSGLNCPLPILKAKKMLSSMAFGERVHVIATDPGSMADFKTFARQTGHTLERCEEIEKSFHFVLRKNEIRQ